MRNLPYLVYGLLFRIFRLIPVNQKKVVLYMNHNCGFHGNLRYIYEEMKRRELSFRFIIMSKDSLFNSKSNHKIIRLLKKIKGGFSFYITLNYHFATAKIICMNDNFLPLAYMPLSKETSLFQLWHGGGAFKQFGLSSEKDKFVRKLVLNGNQQVKGLFVSSKQVIDIYEEALGIKKELIYPTGVPVTDYYFKEHNFVEAKERFYKRYKELKGKKIVFYAPTFRGTDEENEVLLQRFNCSEIKNQLGEEYAILVRMHPQIRPQHRQVPESCYDVTEYSDVKDLYVVSDLLITDYSSVLVEYVLLDKPIILYAYDLERYDRGFYFDYREMMPGPIVVNQEQLISCILNNNIQSTKKREHFIDYEYDCMDGQSTKRVVDLILELSK